VKEIKKDIEQLEEASQQLSKRTPTGARLALLLLDNLAELLMYKKVRLEFARCNQYQAVIPPKYSPKKQKDVMDYFGDKVNFLVSETKDISQDEGDCLKIAHQLRNEAYHTGILRRSIIIQVTKIYFEVICRLLPCLWLGSYMYSSQDDVTTFLKRYNIDSDMIDNTILSRICNFLLGKNTCSVSKLSKALSVDLLERIGETLSGLDYLSEGGYERTTAKAVLKEMQFSEWLANNYEFPKTDKGFQQYIKTRKKLFSKYKPPITMDIIKLWKRQAKTLKLATMPGAALRKFADIDVKLLPIEQKVSEAVFQYDEMINAQIHDR
jgi:hypothetical protein